MISLHDGLPDCAACEHPAYLHSDRAFVACAEDCATTWCRCTGYAAPTPVSTLHGIVAAIVGTTLTGAP